MPMLVTAGDETAIVIFDNNVNRGMEINYSLENRQINDSAVNSQTSQAFVIDQEPLEGRLQCHLQTLVIDRACRSIYLFKKHTCMLQ